MTPLAKEILTFWFGTTNLTLNIEKRQVWFKSTAEFDAELIENYSEICEQARAGDLDHLTDTAEDCLTLILALDQFPRNIHRGTPRAFDSDSKAREIARLAIDRRYDLDLARWPRTFVYLPFEHSENLADQELSLSLYRSFVDEEGLVAATGHHEAIRRFGRFPHRNDVLGRANTPEEDEYLRDPPLWGKTAAEAAELEKRKREEEAG